MRENAANTLRSIADRIAPDLSTPEAMREHLTTTHGYNEYILAEGDIFVTHEESHEDPESIRHAHRHIEEQ